MLMGYGHVYILHYASKYFNLMKVLSIRVENTGTTLRNFSSFNKANNHQNSAVLHHLLHSIQVEIDLESRIIILQWKYNVGNIYTKNFLCNKPLHK